jgi:zinc protease
VKRRRLVVLTALIAAVRVAMSATPADAQGIPRIQFDKYTLANGLEIILHRDRSVPLVAVEVYYKVGSGDEQKGRTGFAHLFEHVMFMGSENVPVGAFDQWLEAAGGTSNGSTNTDRTNYWEQLPSNALPLALWLEADRMGRLLPTLDQAKLDLQRDVVKNERRERYDNRPYGRADETVSAALYPAGHPYSWPTIGSMADLSAASLDDVKGFFRTYYAPNNASLTIAGDFDTDSVRAWVQRYFAPIRRGPEVPARPAPGPVVLLQDTALVLEDRVQLPRAYYTWPTVRYFHPDDAALDILAYILAGDKNSRLYKRLVYDEQIAQSPYTRHTSVRLGGFFRVEITPRPGKTPVQVMKVVDEELARLVRDGIEPRELARAKNTIRVRFLDDLASVLGKATHLSSYNYFVGTPDYVQEDAARYQRVTVEEVRRVAGTYLTRPKVILTVVPEGKTDLMVKANVVGARP